MDSKNRIKKDKFCIITTQRSGSTWFQDLLSCHPEIKVFGELFLWRREWERVKTQRGTYKSLWTEGNSLPHPSYYRFANSNFGSRPQIIFQYLDQLHSYQGSHQTLGFKLMYNQLLPRPEILIDLINNEYKIIHLVRANYLDILISKASLQQNNAVHFKGSHQSNASEISLNSSQLLRDLRVREAIATLIRNILHLLPNRVIEISYESICSDKNSVMDGVIDFLGVPRLDITYNSEFQKVNLGVHRQKISNYEEVLQVLKGSKFKSLLH
ncbi:sulfotransferase [Acaryochloris sp. IP29b_bin.137]|uniref:sulfotransferase n=1 Tax=Acaryochloris sp. IP29b_bin.137 TaxID=2969217 RepID=UPI00344D8BA8